MAKTLGLTYAVCEKCGRFVSLNRDGTLRVHVPVKGAPVYDRMNCSGRRPVSR